ncbi:MAG: ankyrin repeat domain-containing protein [Planctomycetota bacterium]
MNDLIDAIENDDVEKLASIIADGLDVNVSIDAGIRPLHLAADKNATECILLLIENGAIVNSARNSREGSGTPLHFAARSGNFEAIKYLLEAGANPTSGIQGPYGTPFDIVPQKLVECTQILKKAILKQVTALNRRFSDLESNAGPQPPAFH